MPVPISTACCARKIWEVGAPNGPSMYTCEDEAVSNTMDMRLETEHDNLLKRFCKRLTVRGLVSLMKSSDDSRTLLSLSCSGLAATEVFLV